MASPHRKNAVYGNLVYDLDALVRERQLEEAGKLPQKKQPAVQEQPFPRRQTQSRTAARPSPLVVGGIVVLLVMVVALMLGYITHTDVSGSVSSIKREIADLDEQPYLQGYNLDVDQLVRDELLLNLPMKVLCDEDCKGICNRCGANLNHETCDCDRSSLDPRMSVIQDIFKQFKEV